MNSIRRSHRYTVHVFHCARVYMFICIIHTKKPCYRSGDVFFGRTIGIIFIGIERDSQFANEKFIEERGTRDIVKGCEIQLYRIVTIMLGSVRHGLFVDVFIAIVNGNEILFQVTEIVSRCSRQKEIHRQTLNHAYAQWCCLLFYRLDAELLSIKFIIIVVIRLTIGNYTA